MDNEKCAVYVRYLKDKEKEICPLSFVYGFEKDPYGVINKGSDAILEVFWSPNEDDSPSLMAKKVSEIPHYTASATINKKPGYYEANVLRVAESDFELKKQLDEPGRSKRFKTPSLLAIESRATDLLQQSGKKNTSSNKRKVKINKESAHTVLAEKFVAERKKLSWSNKKNIVSDEAEEESTDDSDDDIILKKLHKEAMQDKENQIKSMEKKIRKLENELEELRTLNMLYQKKLLLSSSESSTESHVQQPMLSPPCTIASALCMSSSSSFKPSLPVSSAQVLENFISTIPPDENKSLGENFKDNEEKNNKITKLYSLSTSISPISVLKCTTSTPVQSRTPTTHTVLKSRSSAYFSSVSTETPCESNIPNTYIEDSIIADSGFQPEPEPVNTAEIQQSATANQIIKADKIQIHKNPDIWVPVVGWEKIKNIVDIMNMDPSTNNETGDKTYIYALTQHMFGTEKLLTHVISNCNVQKKKFLDGEGTAPSNKFLEKDLLAAIYGAQARRYYILNKESADPKSERITPTKINYHIGRKAFNLKKSEKARQEKLAKALLNNQ